MRRLTIGSVWRDCAPSVGINPAFGRGVVVDDRLLLRAIDTRREAFEEGLIRRERDLECRPKISLNESTSLW